MKLAFTYTGSEALSMLKETMPKTWEQEIEDGQIFIKAIMRAYSLTANEAFSKYLKQVGTPDKAISTLAALHVMSIQANIGKVIKELEQEQLVYGNQLAALELSQVTSAEDKRTLRQFYLEKQGELQKRIDNLIFDYPIIGAKKVVVQANLFDN